MHPAPSIILFTSLSGLGFGLLMMLGLGYPDVSGGLAFLFFALAYGLAVGGLIASTLHLGHPERALKAFTQWRSSWLSREGWLAVATLLVMAPYGFGLVFIDTRLSILGVLGSLLALATVFATSMIYMQLRTIPRWNHWSPPVLFLGYSIAGGTLLAGEATVALWLLIILGLVQIVAWFDQDRHETASETTLGTATGLGTKGTVRAFEPPHTGSNYLTNEMGFRVARKHAAVLKVIALTLAFILPVFFLMPVTFNLGGVHIFAALATLSHIAGVFVQRWLFFAEAKHVVSLYYGR
ncbi:MAG: DmsC/YnfH family molybdoenzyme membrane anchor subunit [Pseudomonadota bacterium]